MGQGRDLLPADGSQAVAKSAYREAVRYWEQALQALGHLPPSRPLLEQAIDLRCDLSAWRWHQLGHYGRADSALRA